MFRRTIWLAVLVATLGVAAANAVASDDQKLAQSTLVRTADLPGGNGVAAPNCFDPTVLKQNYQSGQPIWLLEQQ